VRSIFASMEVGDFAAAGWAHPDIEFVYADGPHPGNWTGPSGMAQGWRDVLGAWDDLRPEVDEYRELDEIRTLVLFRFRGRGKARGLELGDLSNQGANIFHVRQGKVTRIDFYFDGDRALADLGVEG
jgi:ketosteroid isomerase-like protein